MGGRWEALMMDFTSLNAHLTCINFKNYISSPSSFPHTHLESTQFCLGLDCVSVAINSWIRVLFGRFTVHVRRRGIRSW